MLITYKVFKKGKSGVVYKGELPNHYSNNDCFIAISELHKIKLISPFEFERNGEKLVVTLSK